MNGFLRGQLGPDQVPAGTYNNSILMNKALKDTPGLHSDTVMHRGINDATLIKELQPGDVFKDDGFTSTTISADVTDMFTVGGGAKMHILVPKGSEGAYIEALSGNPIELEYILPLGSHFKVLQNDGMDIYVEYQGHSMYSSQTPTLGSKEYDTKKSSSKFTWSKSDIHILDNDGS